jgi:hypothetical protein
VRNSIEKIDLLVVGARQPSWLTEQADWILPITHSFEEDDICVHRNPELPCLSLPRSEAVVSPYGESKSIDVILKELSGTFSSSFKGPWGNHLKLGSRPICNLDLHLWLERLLDFGQTNPLPRQADLRYQGESDRSLWRPEKNKIQFSVPVLKELFKNITIPTTSDDFPFLLHCSGSVDDAPDNAHRSAPLESFAAVHPDTGLATGMYQIKTRFGCIEVELRHDETLRTDVLRAPFARIPGVLDILPDTTSAYTGTPVLDGTPCSLSIIESQTNIDS